MAVRRALENAGTFSEAKKYLESVPLMSGCYFILGGVNPYEGAVITRLPNELRHIEQLDEDKGIWYLCQTNYDRDIPDPPVDPRRSVCQQKMAEIGQNATKKDVYGVLTTAPVWNTVHGYTIQSTVMKAEDATFNTTIWLWQEPTAPAVPDPSVA